MKTSVRILVLLALFALALCTQSIAQTPTAAPVPTNTAEFLATLSAGPGSVPSDLPTSPIFLSMLCVTNADCPTGSSAATPVASTAATGSARSRCAATARCIRRSPWHQPAPSPSAGRQGGQDPRGKLSSVNIMKTALRVEGEITKDGHLLVDLPPELPSGRVVVTLELLSEDDLELTEEDLRGAGLTAEEIAASPEIGAWCPGRDGSGETRSGDPLPAPVSHRASHGR